MTTTTPRTSTRPVTRYAAAAGFKIALLTLTLSTVAMVSIGTEAVAAVCPGYANKLFCAELSGDCKVTATDALAALRMSVGQVADVDEGDMDHSGAVSASDALKILKIAVAILSPSLSCASQYALDAVASGYYNEDGVHGANNYAAGWYTGQGGAEFRDYFVFDVSSVPGTIASGFLHVSSVATGQSTYSSKDASETFLLYSVTTAIGTLTGGLGGTTTFADLADGTVYGGVTVDKTLTMILEAPLNASGVAALNAASAQLAFGGAITTLAKGATGEYLFNATGVSSTRKLIVTVQ